MAFNWILCSWHTEIQNIKSNGMATGHIPIIVVVLVPDWDLSLAGDDDDDIEPSCFSFTNIGVTLAHLESASRALLASSWYCFSIHSIHKGAVIEKYSVFKKDGFWIKW